MAVKTSGDARIRRSKQERKSSRAGSESYIQPKLEDKTREAESF